MQGKCNFISIAGRCWLGWSFNALVSAAEHLWSRQLSPHMDPLQPLVDWTLNNPLSIWTLSIFNSLLIWHLFDPFSIQLHGIDPLLSPSHANGVGIFALCVLSSHQKLCALDQFNRAMEPELSKTCIFARTCIFSHRQGCKMGCYLTLSSDHWQF